MNGIHNLEVVAFCNRRLDPHRFHEVAEQFPAGVMTQGIPFHLQSGNYIPVLSAIWGDDSVERRVEWLRFYADLHAPLMYELAIAEFEANPTVDTVVSISLPLIQAATFRTFQDAHCSEGGNASEEMRSTYAHALKRAVELFLPSIDWNQTVRDCDAKIIDATFGKLVEVTDQVLEDPYNLPSPAWIGAPLPDPGQIAAIRGRLAANLSRRLRSVP